MQILWLLVKCHMFYSAVVNRNSVAVYENTYSHCLAEKRFSEKNVHVAQLEPNIQLFDLWDFRLLQLY
jgi:hypothetical protein